MREIEKRKFGVALLLLPILIFSVCASASYANDLSSSSNLPATVRVVPTAKLECQPNPLVTGTNEKIVTCYVELENFDASKIIPSSLRLSLADGSVTPIPVLSNSPNKVGDYDKNNVKDLKVTFDKKIIDTWFANYLPKDFTFKMTGEIEGVPGYVFAATDIVQVISPSYTFVYFYGSGGEVRTIKGIDMTTAKITGSRIERSGHQLVKYDKSGFVKNWEDVAGTVTGELPVEIMPGVKVNMEFAAWVRYKDNKCVFTPSSALVCDGNGALFKRGLAVGYSREDVTIHFETDGVKATIIARQGSTIVFEQLNVPLKNFDYTIKTRSSFLFLN